MPNDEGRRPKPSAHLAFSAFGIRLSAFSRFDDPPILLLRIDEAQAELVEHLLQQARFTLGEIAARLRLDHLQQADHLRRALEIQRLTLAADRIGEIPEVHGCRARKHDDEAGKGGIQIWRRRGIGHRTSMVP
jgi:hypothetical protein